MKPAAGIDIGRSSVHVARASGDDPKRYPVTEVNLKRGWEDELCSPHTIPPYAVVTFEPTGWNYSHPITAAITRRRPDCTIWQVEHASTKRTREDEISDNKTDINDARALAFIASRIANGNPPRKTKPHNQNAQEAILALRLTVNAYTRATRDHTRNTNRYRQAAHAISPLLSKSNAYETAVGQGIITPEQLAAAQASPTLHPSSAAHIRRLAAAIDPQPVHPQIVHAIALAYEQMIYQAREKEAARARIIEALQEEPFTATAAAIMTIPRATETAAAIIVATWGAENVDQFKAACGQFPQRSQSGANDESKSTKKGYRPAMNALQMWTMALIQADDNPIAAYFDGGEKNGGRKMSAARAKLCRIIWGTIQSGKYHE